jgi:hypothetical protein
VDVRELHEASKKTAIGIHFYCSIPVISNKVLKSMQEAVQDEEEVCQVEIRGVTNTIYSFVVMGLRRSNM